MWEKEGALEHLSKMGAARWLAAAALAAGASGASGAATPVEPVYTVHPPYYGVPNAGSSVLKAKYVGDLLVVRFAATAWSSLALFLDLDLNEETGYNNEVAQTNMPPKGTEVSLLHVVSPLALPKLYTGCAPDSTSGCNSLVYQFTASEFERVSAVNAPLEYEYRLNRTKLCSSSVIAFCGPNAELQLSFRVSYTSSSVSSEVFPEFYLSGYPVYSTDLTKLPACDSSEERAAVVFDPVAQGCFFSAKAFSQLFMSTQSQVRQAGLPLELISMAGLLDFASSCKYNVVVLPSPRCVDRASRFALRKALFVLSNFYGVGVVSAGNLATGLADGSAAPGDVYSVMTTLGLGPASPSFATGSGAVEWTAAAPSHAMLADLKLAAGALLGSSKPDLAGGQLVPASTLMFAPKAGSNFAYTAVANQKMPGATGLEFSAVLAGQLAAVSNPFGSSLAAGRVVHFAVPEGLVHLNLGWRAVRWARRRDASLAGAASSGLSLQLSRSALLVSLKVRMDTTNDQEAIKINLPAFAVWLRELKQSGSVVGTHFVTQGTSTDWALSGPAFKALLDLGSDLGSLTLSDPADVNALSDSQLQREFQQGMAAVRGNMSALLAAPAEGVPAGTLGGAIPGVFEEGQAALAALEPVFAGGRGAHLVASSSFVGSGYLNAFGYATSSSKMVLMHPNLISDLQAVKGAGWNQSTAAGFWLGQLATIATRASTALVQWPIADIGATKWGPGVGGAGSPSFIGGAPEYGPELYAPVFSMLATVAPEFVLTADLAARIDAFGKARLAVLKTATDTYSVEALFPKASDAAACTMGYYSLLVHQDESTELKTIAAVDNHYAYSDSRVFMPRAGTANAPGQKFTVRLAAAGPAAPPAHITALDQRMHLDAVTGDGSDLNFTLSGEGKVVAVLDAAVAAGNRYRFTSTALDATFQLAGRVATITFPTRGTYVTSLRVTASSAPSAVPTTQPTAYPTARPTMPTSKPSAVPSKAPSGQPPTSAPGKTSAARQLLPSLALLVLAAMR